MIRTVASISLTTLLLASALFSAAIRARPSAQATEHERLHSLQRHAYCKEVGMLAFRLATYRDSGAFHGAIPALSQSLSGVLGVYELQDVTLLTPPMHQVIADLYPRTAFTPVQIATTAETTCFERHTS